MTGSLPHMLGNDNVRELGPHVGDCRSSVQDARESLHAAWLSQGALHTAANGRTGTFEALRPGRRDRMQRILGNGNRCQAKSCEPAHDGKVLR